MLLYFEKIFIYKFNADYQFQESGHSGYGAFYNQTCFIIASTDNYAV